MKLKSLLTTLAAAVGLTTAAVAATPTVVWDRDFDTTTKKGTDGKTYTFAANGNGVENGIISITQAYGATVTFPEENANGYTVIIKYSNLSAISDRMPIFAGFATSYGNASDYGVAASENGGLGLSGYWFESSKRYAFDSPTPTLAEGSGYVVISHKIGNRLRAYTGATLAAATGEDCGLSFSSGNATAIGLGGASKDSSSATCGLTGWNNGLRIEAVAIFAGQFYAATDVASYKFPSECGVLKNARWGNIGDAINGGVATGADQAAAANTSYTVNFGTTDNICTTEIGSKGTVKIKTLKVVAHGTAGNMPPSITLTQGSLSATSTALDSSQTISIYKSNKTVYETKQLLLYTFAGDVAFDTSADITMSFANGTAGQGGCRFVTPANSKMKFNGTWSPAVEFVGDYTVARRSISINFNSGAGSVSGTYGVFPSSTWNNYSDATCSGGKTANVSDGSTVTVKWWSHNTYSWGGNDVDAALRGYLDDGACGDGTTGNGPHIGITGIPFEKYDVIAYLATDTSGRNFAPPAIGTFTGTSACATTAYSYDGLTSANRNTASLNFGTSRNATAQLGVNVVYLKKGFSQSDLDIKGGQNDNSTCRGGIAAIQIVEAFPSDYAATIDAETATWSTQDGLTTISGRPDGDNIDSSTLTLSNTTQDDATVNFDTLVGYNKIAVTSASGKSTTLSCTTAPVVGSNYEIGGLAKLTYVPDVLITILSGGTLTLANTTAGTQSKIISGAGNLDIAGPVTLSANNTLTGTMTVKNGGTLTMGSASCLNGSQAVTIEQGGVVDYNGKKDGLNNFTLAGGTLVNNGSEIGTGNKQTVSVTVTADSTIGGTGNFGLINNGYAATTLTLNENTTLTKTGANSFWLVTTTAKGTGKLAIKQGTINCVNRGSGVNFQDATVELDGGNLEVNKAATLKNLSYKSGTLKANAAISGLTDISGDFDTTSSSCLSGSGALGFADAVTFHDGTIRLNESILTTLGTAKTVTIGDNGILDIRATRAIKVASIGTDAKLAVKQQASETETITVTDTTLEDGDYLAKVQVIEAEDDTITMPIKSAAVSSGTLTITLDKTVFAYEVTGNTTISAIETACVGEGKTFEEAAQLTITATGNPTITVDKNLHITKFALVGEATLKFNNGMVITAPTISAENTVTIDCTGIAAGEHTYFVGTIADTTKFTASNVPEGQGIYVTATGVTIRKTANTTYANPVVTTEEKTFAQSFFGTTDAAWDTLANWRKAEGGLWIPATVVPGKQDGGYGTLVLDGNMTSEKTVTAAQLEGWTPQYALYNGMTVTVTKLVKMQTDNQGFIWVDASSSITFNTSGGNNHGTLALAVANADGVTFTQKWSAGDNTISYYLTGSGSVNYAAGVSAGTHKIAQMDLTVGATAKDCRHVAKQKLVNFGASSSVTFSAADGIVVNLDNDQVTATYIDTVPACTNEVGVYTIATESDGVYAYIVQYADAWDIVEPLTGTLTENMAWTGIVWKDAYDHTGADTTKVHTYKLAAGEFTATLNAAPADGSTIEVVSGTLALNDAEVIAAYTPITVDDGATLAVTASGLKASKVTNNGTIAFAGGTSDDPIVITGDANLNNTTLAANTWVWNKEGGSNKKYNVSGAGASSYYILTRGDDGAPGMNSGTTFSNLILIAKSRETQSLWLENTTLSDGTVGFCLQGQMILNNSKDSVIRSLTGTWPLKRYHSEAIEIRALEDATFSGLCDVPVTIDASEHLQTFSGSMTSTLTVNEDATVRLTGSAKPSSITNNGTVIYDFGADTTNALKTASFTNNGTVEVKSGVVLVPSGFPGTITASGTGVVLTSYTVGINDLGKFAIPAGKTWDTIVIVDKAGNVLPITSHDDTYVYFDWEITGGACWWDYEFDGNVNNSGTEGTALTWDGDRPFKGAEFTEDGALHVPTRPWRNVSSWPTTATFVMFGKMVASNNTYQIVFGSTTYGSYNTIFLATGDTSKDEVVLCRGSKQSSCTKLCTMTVPNAASADHLYAFTLKTVDNKTSVDIYLDGELLQAYPFDEAITLGTGFQIASPHGGVVKGYARPSDSDPATLDWLRVYDTELSQAAIEKYAVEYPYVSPNGSYQRTVKDGDVWSATSAWTKEGTEPEEKADVPVANATVKLTVDGTTTLGVNLDESISYEAIKINGGDLTLALAEGETEGKVISVGRVTANANVTFKYDAFTMFNAPLTVKAGKTVTFDLSMVDMTKFFSTQHYDLTGYVTLEDGANVAFVAPTELHGREVSAAIDETTKHYILTVTVPVKDFTYENGTWKWGDSQTVDAETVSNNTTLAIVVKSGTLEWPMDRASFTVEGGTLKATSAGTSAVEVKADATFDLNGISGSAYAITLAGGSLVNTGAALADQNTFTTLTLTADSKLGGTSNFTMQKAGYAATTINLGGYTLTKEGANLFSIVTTTVNDAGTIYVKEGTLYSSESTTFSDTTASIKIGEKGTLHQRYGRTLTVSNIIGEGGTLNNEGTVNAFTLTGAISLTNAGSFGVITLADSATIDVGQKRGLTINEAGTVKATITADEIATDSLTVFKSTSETKPTVTLVDEQGAAITTFPAAYDESGNYVVQFSTSFTIADVDNATKTVEGATLVEGNTYKATLGTEVTVTYTAVAGYHFGDGKSSVTVKETAAKDITITTTATTTKYPVRIGSTYYLTLAAALDATDGTYVGSYVELCDNVTFVPNGAYSITNTIYLTLNGYSLTGNGDKKTFEVVNNAVFSITATGSTVTGVRINVGKATNDNGALYITGGTWTIDDNTLVHVNGTCKNSAVYIYDATMTSVGDNAIQLCGAGTYVIDGGTITGATAVYAKAGTLQLAAALVANGAKTEYKYNENGANATGDAIVIDNCGYPEGPAAVSLLTGTTLTSDNNAKMGYYVYNGSAEGTVQKDNDVEVNTPAGYLWKNGKLVKKVGFMIFAK